MILLATTLGPPTWRQKPARHQQRKGSCWMFSLRRRYAKHTLSSNTEVSCKALFMWACVRVSALSISVRFHSWWFLRLLIIRHMKPWDGQRWFPDNSGCCRPKTLPPLPHSRVHADLMHGAETTSSIPTQSTCHWVMFGRGCMSRFRW